MWKTWSWMPHLWGVVNWGSQIFTRWWKETHCLNSQLTRPLSAFLAYTWKLNLMFRSLTDKDFFCAETRRLETLRRRYYWREKDVNSSWNIINRGDLHKRLVYNSRCFQETSSSFSCFQQVHYFELFCSVLNEVVFEPSPLVLLVSWSVGGFSNKAG